MYKAYSESVSAFGALQGTNVTGTSAIATIPAASLPFGLYRVDVYSQVTTIANAATPSNAALFKGTTQLVRLIFHIVAQNSGAYQPKQPLSFNTRLDGNTALSVNFLGNFAATETQDWIVSIVATRIAD